MIRPTYRHALGALIAASTALAIAACASPAPAPVALNAQAEGTTVTVRVTPMRHVQAVFADIERVTIELQTSAGLTYQKTVDRAALGAGQAAATFTGLPRDSYTVWARAYDASNKLIGEKSGSTNTQNLSSVQVVLTMTLAPTYTGTPAPSVDTSIELTNLAETGTVAVRVPLTGATRAAVDDHDALWVLVGTQLRKIAPDGQTAATVTTSGLTAFTIDHQDRVWTLQSGAVTV